MGRDPVTHGGSDWPIIGQSPPAWRVLEDPIASILLEAAARGYPIYYVYIYIRYRKVPYPDVCLNLYI